MYILKLIEIFLEYIDKIFNTINDGFFLFSSQKKTEIAEQRLRRFYSPVYRLFREYLYADFSKNEIQITKHLKKIPKLRPEDRFLIGGNFEFHLGRLNELLQNSNANHKSKQKAYDNLCSEIDKTYGVLCRQFNIPLQDIKYTLRQKKLRLWWMFRIAIKDAFKCTFKVLLIGLPIYYIFFK